MRARMMNGFWVHNPPMGYRYQKSPNGGSILVRDEPLASIIAEGWKAMRPAGSTHARR